MILFIAFLAFVTFTLIAALLLYTMATPEGAVAGRLRGLRTVRQGEGSVVQQELSPLEKLLARFGNPIQVPVRYRTRIQTLLLQSGYRKRGLVQVFMGVKLVAAVLVALLAYTVSFLLMVPDRLELILITLFGVAAGFVLPNFILARVVKSRQRDIFYTLPDMLDLLTVCVEAGLGLDAAVLQVAREANFAEKELGKEFLMLNQQIRAGMARREALKDLVDRTGVDGIKSLAAMLIQTEKLGTSLAQTLRVHSDSLRTKRRQMAEEAAAKISVKLVLPLALFVLPAIFVVILGPGIIQILKVF